MKRLRVSSLAERDLDRIWHYAATNSGSIEIADSLIDSITDIFRLLARTPQAGTKRDELGDGIRGFPAGRYIVYYQERGKHLEISRVIHGMREQKRAYSDEG